MKFCNNQILLFIPVSMFCIALSSPEKIRCPRNIKVFAAFPFNELSKRHYYYECDENKEAILKSCNNGEIYNPELEACDVSDDLDTTNENRRVKRQTDNQGSQNGNKGSKKSKIKQKRLGRNVRLGALYYGQTDDVHVDEHLWDRQRLNDTYKTTTKYKRGWAKVSQNTMDRINNFDINARLGVSFLGGLVSVSGSARYLSERRDRTNSVIVSYFYEIIASTESITQDIAGDVTYKHLCSLVGEKNGPTLVGSGPHCTTTVNGLGTTQKGFYLNRFLQ